MASEFNPYQGLVPLSVAGGAADPYAPVVDVEALPRFELPKPDYAKRGILAPGLRAGWNELQSLSGSAAQAVGKAVGSQGIENWGAEVAQRNAQEAQAAGRPDLDVAPWREGGGGWGALPSYVGYQVAKNLPLMGAQLAGAALMPEAAVPAALSRAGAVVPEILGGGGLRAGASEAAKQAAEAAGKTWGKNVAGATVAGYPAAVGSIYQEASEREKAGGGPADRGDAFKALGLGVPYAMLDAVEPAQLERMAAKGLAGNLPRRLIAGATAGALGEMPQEALQTAMEQSFRPDLSVTERAHNIIDAALTGGLVGGVLGGTVGGVRRMKAADPAAATNDDLAQAVDQDLTPAASAPAEQEVLPGFTPTEPQPGPFAGQPDADVQQALQLVEQKMQQGGATQEDAQLRQQLLQEVDRRAQAAPAAPEASQQIDMFPEPAPAPVEEMQQFAPLSVPEQVAQTRAWLAETSGLKPDNKMISRFETRDQVETYQQVQSALDVAKPNRSMRKIAESLGLMTSDGTRTTPQETLATLNQQVEAAWQKAKETGAKQDQVKATELQAKARAFAPMVELQQQAEARQAEQAQRLDAEGVFDTPEQLVAAAEQPAPIGAVESFESEPIDMGGPASRRRMQRMTMPAQPAEALQSTPIESQPAQPAITPEAESLLASVDAGGVPGVMTNNLRRIAEENGIEVAPVTTPNDVIDQLRVKQQPPSAPASPASTPIQPAAPTVQPLSTAPAPQAPIGGLDAVQVGSPAQNDVLQNAAAGGEVLGGNPEGNVVAAESGRVEPVQISAAPGVEGQISAAPGERQVSAAPGERQVSAAPGEGQRQAVPAQEVNAPAPPQARGQSRPPQNTEEANQTVRKVVDTAKTVLRRVEGSRAVARNMFDTALGWMSVGHMRDLYDKTFDGAIGALYNAHRGRTSIAHTFAKWNHEIQSEFDKLEQKNPKLADDVTWLMGATRNKIRPGKDWAYHKWLHGLPNEDALKAEVQEAKSRLDRVQQAGYRKIYDALVAGNEAQFYAMNAYELYRSIKTDPTVAEAIKVAQVDPMERFLKNEKFNATAGAARDYWKGVWESQAEAVNKYAAPLRKDLNEFYESREVDENGKLKSQKPYRGRFQTAEAARQADARLSPLEMQVEKTRLFKEGLEQAPYFHLGRQGEFMVAFTMKAGDDKKTVDPAAQLAIEQRLYDKGFTDIEISRGNTQRGVYIRLETEAEMERLFDEINVLAKEGFVDASEKLPIRGHRTENDIKERLPVSWVDRLIEHLRLDRFEDLPEEDAEMAQAKQEELISSIRKAYLDIIPDNSIARVMAQRSGRPGYSKDMMRSYAYRTSVGINAMAGLVTQHKVNDALNTALRAVQAAKSAPDVDVVKVRNIYNELYRREMESPARVGYDVFEVLRAVDSSWQLGFFNPAYVLTNVSSIGTMLWPELVKLKGVSHLKAAQAIGRATNTSFKIVRAIFDENRKLGWKRATDTSVTEQALKAAGLSEADRRFVMEMEVTGAIDFGGQATELTRIAEGRADDRTDMVLRVGSAFGRYSEVFSRLTAALAAKEVYGSKEGLVDYATYVVDQSMLNQANWNVARQTGKTGLFKNFSPLVFQFHNYQFQVLEKLYREAHDAFVGANPDAAAASRRYLAGHLTAITMLAGTLGLPFAAIAARAFDALRDLWDEDDEPHDAMSDWRVFLADTFGPEIGEVLARGVPRGLNADISQRAGEQDLAPFTRLLVDRRKWDDALKDWGAQAWGAPASMFRSIISGAEKAMNGDVLDGMIEMVPAALRGPAKAFRMTERGYVDSHDNQMPLTPSASAYLSQLLGFTPGEYANYREKDFALRQRENVLRQEGGTIRRQLSQAIQQGDSTGDLIAEARAFDSAHPAYAVLPKLGSTLRSQQTKRAVAEKTGLPLSANLRDVEGLGLVRY